MLCIYVCIELKAKIAYERYNAWVENRWLMLHEANFKNYYLYVTLVTKYACVCLLGQKEKVKERERERGGIERGRHFLQRHADCTLFEHVIECFHRVLHLRVAMVVMVLQSVGGSASGEKL